MRRIRDSRENETMANAYKAYDNYSDQKHHREYVQEYEKQLQGNLQLVVDMIIDESWQPKGYREEYIFERKLRKLAKAPIEDHVLETATILPYEKALYDYSTWRAPAVKPGLGTHAMFRFLRNELARCSQQELAYYLPMDIHHYFPMMWHQKLIDVINGKVKPGKFRRFLLKVVESYHQGAPLGIKVAQIFGQIYLASFDRLVMRFFDIAEDDEKMAYWTRRYIEGCIVTARTPDEARELGRGSLYLERKFRRSVEEGVQHYFRFVDNILFMHSDKQVLQILKELAIMHLTRDWHCIINSDYNVRPTWMGIRMVGYEYHHSHTRAGKRNKKELARHIHKLRKKGYDEEQIRVKLASRIGFVKHAKCKHLFKTLGMEKTLGKIIKNRRVKPPFKEMTAKQKVPFSSIVNPDPNDTVNKNEHITKILLEDYKIVDSKIDKQKVIVQVEQSDGSPGTVEKTKPEKALAIRFKKILQTYNDDGEEKYIFEKEKDPDGSPTMYDAEFYAFTGSKVLIDQAINDFSTQDLPCPTVVQQFKTKEGKTFVKFT